MTTQVNMTTAAEFDKKYSIVNSPTPRHTLLSGHYKQSYAYYTLRERLPVILTGIIDHLTKDKEELVSEYGEDSREEIKGVIAELSRLKYQLQTDKSMELFQNKIPAKDQEMWNKFITELPATRGTFFTACWLYAECYMYRKIYSFFEATMTLKAHDYFKKNKLRQLTSNIEVMQAVANSTKALEKSESVFRKLLKLNLWSNRADLSVKKGSEYIPTGNPFEIIDSFNANVAIDESAAVWKCMLTADLTKPVVIDIVCDNAGYEVFTDFLVADYMIRHQMATKVRFYVKSLPWFISDVTARDFHFTLQFLREHTSTALSELGTKWTQYHKAGVFELAAEEAFWTSPYEYYKMRDIAPDLYRKLGESHLVIFKGDLNYRKLLGDFTWDETEEFITCLRGFSPTNLCTLRTIKADLICGLPINFANKVKRMDPNWMTTGEYGVIQFCENLNCPCSK